jgi:hypothetical protein
MQKSLAAKEDPDVSKCKRSSNGNIGKLYMCYHVLAYVYDGNQKKQNKQTNKHIHTYAQDTIGYYKYL